MGKSTISMVIFNSYFDITRGYFCGYSIHPKKLGRPYSTCPRRWRRKAQSWPRRGSRRRRRRTWQFLSSWATKLVKKMGVWWTWWKESLVLVLMFLLEFSFLPKKCFGCPRAAMPTEMVDETTWSSQHIYIYIYYIHINESIHGYIIIVTYHTHILTININH